MTHATAIDELFDTGAQSANSGLVGDITPSDVVSHLRITIALKSASIVRVTEDDGNTSVSYDLNSGAQIDADELYVFDVPVRASKTYNVQLETSVGIKTLKIDEVTEATV